MTSYTNTRDNSTLAGVGFKDGDDLTTANGSRWVYQNEQWYPVTFGGSPSVQPLTVTTNSAQGVVTLAGPDGTPIYVEGGHYRGPALNQNYVTKAPAEITNYGVSTGNTVAGTGASAAVDNINTIEELNSLALTIGTGACNVVRTIPALASSGQLCLTVHIPDTTKINYVTIKIGTTGGFTTSLQYQYPVNSAPYNNNFNGLHKIYIDKSKWQVLAGAPNWDTDSYVRAMVETSGVAGGVLNIGRVFSGGESRAKLVWTWDDGYLPMYTEVAEYVKGKNFPMTFYVIGEDLFRGWPSRMTIAMWRDLYDRGHDIGNHAYSHSTTDEIGNDAYVADKINMARLLESRGITRNGMAYCHAYVEGKYDAATVDELRAAGFITARTIGIARHMPTWYGVGNQHFLDGGLQLNSSLTLAQAKARVDAARAAGATLVITGHKVEAVAGPLSWAIADYRALVDYVIACDDIDPMSMSSWFAGLSNR